MNTRKLSNAQEKEVAKIIGGRVQPNSGAGDFKKGDVKHKYAMVECKTSATTKKSYSVKWDDLMKLKKTRIEMGLPYAALAFNFGPNTENFYVVSEREFNAFLDMIEREERSCHEN